MKPGCSPFALVAFFYFSSTVLAIPFPFQNSSTTATTATSASTAATFPSASVTANTTTATTTASNTTTALDPNASDCKLALPANALTAAGLSTPWVLLPPCSQTQGGQQAFAEAAVIDSNGQISIYHPLIIDQGKTPAAAPVVPNLGNGAQVALFFGFNGNALTLVDAQGQDTNNSPDLAASKCVNGLPGVQGDLFGQVSWCNTDAFWKAANAGVASGQTVVTPLGQNSMGGNCLSSRSFELIDQDQSDNLPTQYLLMPDGSTAQFTAANQAKLPGATVIDNASDEALIDLFLDPVIGCTPYKVPSIDDPGVMVSSLATQELQALVFQQEPIALVPLNDPDTLLTSSGSQSTAKTNAYRVGVNQPVLGTGNNTDNGDGATYCTNMLNVQSPFLAQFQTMLTNAGTPDAAVGNNLFTFLANRVLMSVTNLGCKNTNIPITCQLDGNQVATACKIAVSATATGNATGTQATGTATASTPASLSGASSSPATASASASLSGASSSPATASASASLSGASSSPATASTPASLSGASSSPATASASASLSSVSISMTTAASAPVTGIISSPTSTSALAAPPGGGRNPPTVSAPPPPPTSLGTGPSATMPPPIQSFSAIPTSATTAAAACTSAIALNNCWEAFGWQLCRLGGEGTEPSGNMEGFGF